ncbi:Aste57867_11007 [Aphanomyces stellatus]|uniref:Aste57867_11007 protein n=1 Tax=Aphanomyces stellatus TaxID=120398 RepID=A0A485KRS2_9STRA|nr:hypothetical protein As57867_010966 [Aphanomyces stellatus]VFT87875.1 Aste57867_11007 [Aphanomyces stellatus]
MLFANSVSDIGYVFRHVRAYSANSSSSRAREAREEEHLMEHLPYGIATEKGPKQSQEDAYYIGAFRGGRLTLNGFTGTNDPEEEGCFGVFDGHGGDRASRHCAEFIFQRIHANLQKRGFTSSSDASESELKSIIRDSILEIDGEFCQLSTAQQAFGGKFPMCSMEDGSTLVIAMIRGDKIFVANVGDSRAVLCQRTSKGKVSGVPLSRDHKPDDPIERQRIEAKGGRVTGVRPALFTTLWPFTRWMDVPRVDGILSMTRAIGDATLKPPISAEPDLFVHALGPTDKYLILACDGLWDVISNDKAAKIACRSPSAQAAASALCKYAMQKASEDNVTVLVVDVAAFSSHPALRMSEYAESTLSSVQNGTH